MPEMTVKSAAKINLALDVTGKLPNGYHTIESVFQTVGLYDEITVKLTDSGINISCDVSPEAIGYRKGENPYKIHKMLADNAIPCDERNIAYKTAKKFFEENNMNIGCDIHIKKNIPSQAGMGGGSSDAAAVIYCLEKLTGGKFPNPEKIGADVPFFLTGGTAYVEGIGEKITPLNDYSGKILVIAKLPVGVSTANAYKNIDKMKRPVHPKVKTLVNAINNFPENAHKYFGNLFEEAVELVTVFALKEMLISHGALNPLMTGSGSAVFGLFESREKAEICAKFLKSVCVPFAVVCETVNKSFIEI